MTTKPNKKEKKDSMDKTVTRTRSNAQIQIPFSNKLVLNQWILSLFNVKSLKEIADILRNESLEGLDENNIHRFHHALTAQLLNLTKISAEQLLEYDQNIVKYTSRLNDTRRTNGEDQIVWKYFQYLALLFTEIYLDRYFSNPLELLKDLNKQINAYNEGKTETEKISQLDETIDAWSQLNKLAFWMATGSGKTLIMHANILQYQNYLEKHGRSRELNRIVLLTPNEGLSKQHLGEFKKSGVTAELFNKDGSLFSGKAVEILEVTRLKDEMGDKTVAVEAFEGNNLVLVDEGHRGSSGGEEGPWMRHRNTLCEKGFSFEYSATFGQAAKGKSKLTDQYAKNTIFDYSYRYFYGDGFGKDYQILNLDQNTQSNYLELYLVAGLLSFYQQQRVYREQSTQFYSFNIEKPLWVFVGGSVTATLASRDGSDIVQILKFFARYVADRTGSIARIQEILDKGLITANGSNLFSGRFSYLVNSGLTHSQIFDDTLATLFNSPAGGQLYIENLKGANGEIALRLGAENEAFGVINVGDDAKLVELCKKENLETGDREFSGSLFHDINTQKSKVNLLIGSKKFTEGWSSWRVSTMGLMNVGKSEGAQIIQLFGRGVRLKGYDMSLKRSNKTHLPEGIERPKHIGTLETLGIFGIHAEYMAQFRDFLEDEGVPTNDDRKEFLLPVIKNLGTQKLKTIRLKKTINGVSTEFGDAFRKLAPIPTITQPNLKDPNEAKQLCENRLILNWYPKIQSMKSDSLGGGQTDINETNLSAQHIAFLDIDKIYFELERYKAERGWYNLNITRLDIENLLSNHDWYKLQIPETELTLTSYESDSFGRKIRLWEEIAIALLKKYTERYYTFRKREWELPHLEYRVLEGDDPNFLGVRESADDGYYRILLDQSREDIIAKLEELKGIISNGEMKPWEFQGMKAVCFGKHLYQPLLYLDSDIVEISPAPLNKGEKVFVEDLKLFYESNTASFRKRELYLLRNLSKGRGVGFFEAGNFHPDFILWLVDGDKQSIIFVDPKGIRNLGQNDPKIQFHQTIKEIESRLGDQSVELKSYIISNTPSRDMMKIWNLSKEEMRKKNILFQEDQDTYISELLK